MPATSPNCNPSTSGFWTSAACELPCEVRQSLLDVAAPQLMPVQGKHVPTHNLAAAEAHAHTYRLPLDSPSIERGTKRFQLQCVGCEVLVRPTSENLQGPGQPDENVISGVRAN